MTPPRARQRPGSPNWEVFDETGVVFICPHFLCPLDEQMAREIAAGCRKFGATVQNFLEMTDDVETSGYRD